MGDIQLLLGGKGLRMDVGVQGCSRRALVLVAVRNYPGALDAFTSGINEQLRAVESWWCDPSLGERAFDPHHVTPLATRRDVEDAVHTIGLRDLTPSCLLYTSDAADE